jgi:hypothetical protein
MRCQKLHGYLPSVLAMLAGLTWLLMYAKAHAQDTFADLDLKDVLKLEITSVSKKPQSVPGYNAVDMRWAWRSSPQTQWELVGRNLLGGRHQEFVSENGDSSAALLGPTMHVGVRLQF